MIAAPPRLHVMLAEKALEAGKHVLVEKPFGLAAEKQKNIFRLAKSLQKTLMVDYTYLYSPGFQYLKKQLKGEGALSYQSLRLGGGIPRPDISVMEDLMVHDLSLLLSLGLLEWKTVRCLPLHQKDVEGAAECKPGEGKSGRLHPPLQQAFAWLRGRRISASLFASCVHPEKTRRVIVRTKEHMLYFKERGGGAGVCMYDPCGGRLLEEKRFSKDSLKNMFKEFFTRIDNKERAKDEEMFFSHFLYS